MQLSVALRAVCSISAPVVLGLTQQLVDQQCAMVEPECYARQGSVCCSMSPKQVKSHDGSSCHCSAADFRYPQDSIDSWCNDPPLDCSAKKSECCGMSPKQSVGTINGFCACLPGDDDAESGSSDNSGNGGTLLAGQTQEDIDRLCTLPPESTCTSHHSDVCCVMDPKQWPSHTSSECFCEAAKGTGNSQSAIDSMCASPPLDCSIKKTECCDVNPKQATVGISGQCQCAAAAALTSSVAMTSTATIVGPTSQPVPDTTEYWEPPLVMTGGAYEIRELRISLFLIAGMVLVTVGS